MFSFNYVYADIISIDKKTGKFIEHRTSNTSNTLIQEAVNMGYKAEDVELRIITPNEWLEIKENQIDKPARERKKAKEDEIKAKELEIKRKLNLTDKEFEDLKEVLKYQSD
jgi:hypothetical protein